MSECSSAPPWSDAPSSFVWAGVITLIAFPQPLITGRGPRG